MKVQRSQPLAAEEFTTVSHKSHNAVKKSHIRSLSLSVSHPTKVLAY